MAVKKLLYWGIISEFIYSMGTPPQNTLWRTWLASAEYLVSSTVDASHGFWSIRVTHSFMNQEVRMCLSTVYIESDTGKEEFMQDVAEMEAEGDGFFLVSLFGERRFIKGSIRRVDFVDEHTVEMEQATKP